eukprot:scaffold102346_cov90-Phaeocystis_antarctica.AAC.1
MLAQSTSRVPHQSARACATTRAEGMSSCGARTMARARANRPDRATVSAPPGAIKRCQRTSSQGT